MIPFLYFFIRRTPAVVLSSRLLCLLICFAGSAASSRAETTRETIARAMVMEDSDEQAKVITSLTATGTDEVRDLLNLWKEGSVFLAPGPEDTKIPVLLAGPKDAEDQQQAVRFVDEKPLLDEQGQPVRLIASDLDIAETDSNTRMAMKGVLDLIALSSPNLQARLTAVSQVGMEQNVELLPALRLRQQKEEDARVRRGLREAIALTQLRSDDQTEQVAAADELGELKSIPSQDALKTLQREAAEERPAVAAAAGKALERIATHVKWVNFYGTLFRGLSLGSILLVVALGLAITFGLMGVINMAHGELIVVGAYATYVVQNVFGAGLSLSLFNRFNIWLPGMNTGGSTYEMYFIVALPVAFFSAALVGLALERGVIRFLYRRPLESLLATWGVSLVLQQLFRLIFGANNVQVYSPSWLSGNWTVNDVLLGWNRVFVIGFAILIVAGTWLLLNKTSLGLLIRAVMQNRQMAACMGVRTERVNMLTFSFGSGWRTCRGFPVADWKRRPFSWPKLHCGQLHDRGCRWRGEPCRDGTQRLEHRCCRSVFAANSVEPRPGKNPGPRRDHPLSAVASCRIVRHQKSQPGGLKMRV
jgi:urea transport system permease protein